MASKAQMALANRLLEAVKRAGTINKFDLMDKESVSIAQWNQISAWFKHRFIDGLNLLEYDKKTKNFKWLGKVEQVAR